MKIDALVKTMVTDVALGKKKFAKEGIIPNANLIIKDFPDLNLTNDSDLTDEQAKQIQKKYVKKILSKEKSISDKKEDRKKAEAKKAQAEFVAGQDTAKKKKTASKPKAKTAKRVPAAPNKSQNTLSNYEESAKENSIAAKKNVEALNELEKKAEEEKLKAKAAKEKLLKESQSASADEAAEPDAMPADNAAAASEPAPEEKPKRVLKTPIKKKAEAKSDADEAPAKEEEDKTREISEAAPNTDEGAEEKAAESVKEPEPEKTPAIEESVKKKRVIRTIRTDKARKEEKLSEAGAKRPARGERSDRPGFKKNDNSGFKRRESDAAPAPDISEKSRKNDRGKKKDKDERRDKFDRFDQDIDSRLKPKKKKGKSAETAKPKEEVKQPEETIKTITLPQEISLQDFASKIKVPVNQLIKKLFLEGKMYTVNTDLSFDEAADIALEYNIISELEETVDVIEELLKDIEDPEDSLTPRPPVVCVMGHVDHGKTSLLDAIRQSNVIEGEAGGITQAIGAYTVKTHERKITFLDTPGHEAFTSMRMRGAQATDIAILVVAADDGVMPQTVEAINHAKAAGIEIIVAVNKIDKPAANIERVKQELAEYELIPEDWGGTTIFCPVSAHTKEGLDNLLDMILLTADVLELKANKDRNARGVVLEAKLDKGRGPVATLLIQKGTLKVGDFVSIGEVSGKVRAMIDDRQRRIKEATPSTPVEIIGLSGVPNSGDIFLVTDTEKEARQISEAFVTRGKENLIAESKSKMSLDDLFDKMQEGTLKELDIIIKADVQGSVEAVKQSLLKLSNEEIIIKCIHAGVGNVNESDVSLAAASNAIIIAFNTKVDAQAKSLADQEKVDLRMYRVIYNAIDDIESAMKGMLDPIFEEKVIGHAEIRSIFKATGVGSIAGSYVTDGVIERNTFARLFRGDEQIFSGKIASLKRFKDDAKEVREGFECGIVLDGFNAIEEGDRIECYKSVEVPR